MLIKIVNKFKLYTIWFGKNQSQLIDLVNSLDYDLLALTGDLGDLDFDSEGLAMQAFLTEIIKKTPIVYVEGNHGPFVRNKQTGEKTEIAYWLEEQGVHLLLQPLIIEEAGQKLWIAEQTEPFWRNEQLQDVTEEDVLISIIHYPMDENFYRLKCESGEFPPYDLILGGHWCIPFYGAIFISDFYENI